jgi:hypothetical protein
MAVMADGGFPFGAIGLVHIENRIDQLRRIGLDEELTLRVRPTQLEPHPRGRTFSLVSEASVNGELAWKGVSTMLRRGHSATADDKPDAHHVSVDMGRKADAGRETASVLEASAEWRLPGDLGRRYAAVSGDRNPIHMHSLTAKPLGFPRAIAHGMWTKARCLAALESRLPDAFSVEVRFRKPILLPSRVEFAQGGQGEAIDFTVRNPKRQTPHLDGHLRPFEVKTPVGRSNSK